MHIKHENPYTIFICSFFSPYIIKRCRCMWMCAVRVRELRNRSGCGGARAAEQYKYEFRSRWIFIDDHYDCIAAHSFLLLRMCLFSNPQTLVCILNAEETDTSTFATG